MDQLPLLISWYVVFVFSVTLHEAAHAYVAKLGGDLTAYRGGQVSLDPRPHMKREPVGMLVLPIISLLITGWPFGYASAPYDPLWADRHPKRAALMALAGPMANLFLVILAGLAIKIGLGQNYFIFPEKISLIQLTLASQDGLGQTLAQTLAMLLSITFSLNLILAVLNLFPIPPLDGSGVIGLIVSENHARTINAWLRQPHIALIGIVIAWNIFGKIFAPIFLAAFSLLYPEQSY